jgi:hypothetical protein
MPPPCWRAGERLNPCALALFRRDVEQTWPLPWPWIGWRMQRGVLVGPGGMRWTPETLRHAAHWQSGHREADGLVRTLADDRAAPLGGFAPSPGSRASP